MSPKLKMNPNYSKCKYCHNAIFECQRKDGSACECGAWYDVVYESVSCANSFAEDTQVHEPITELERYVNEQ